MMRLLLLLSLFFCLGYQNVYSQYYSERVKDWGREEIPDSSLLNHSVFLVGNMGGVSPNSSNMLFLRKKIMEMGQKSTLLMLGDNDVRMSQQEGADNPYWNTLDLLVNDFNGKIYYVPGEGDWNRGRRDGWNVVRYQEQTMENFLGRGDVFQPSGGCPGPVEIELTQDVVLIVVDSQWWLHGGDRPQQECGFEEISDFLILLSDALKRNKEKKIIFATHHPIYNAGKFGGHFPFPGPVELYRKFIGTPQDFSHPFYKRLRYFSRKVFRDLNDIMVVSSHDKSMQYVKKGNIHQIIAGSGVAAQFVGRQEMDFTASQVGFSRINFYENDQVWIEFWAFGKKGDLSPKCVFSKRLYSRRVRSQQEIMSQFEDLNLSDSLTVPASTRYLTSSKIKTKWLGHNYRDEWATPIKVPVFDLGRERGGLTILKRGGGQQTRSLRLSDKNGKQYVLRSIEKYTQRAIPEVLRGTFAAQVLQDGISGSHPYGALAVPSLARAARVYHTNPRIVYVPDDPRLGIYKDDFKNELFLFEERPEGDCSDMPWFGNSSRIISTDKLLKKKYKNTDCRVDEYSVLRSRLFDIFLNDWDRHDDQWRWALFDSDNYQVARPIPRDRDQVFFFNEGALPWLIRRKWAIRKFQPFDSITHDVVGLGFNSRYFDRTFLSSLSGIQWQKMAKILQDSITDKVIMQAVSDLPDEIYDLSGEIIVEKLKGRRDRLPQMAEEFYSFLAKQVDVVGTDEKEYFDIRRFSDGALGVKVYKKGKHDKLKDVIFSRRFLPEETNEVRLYGLGGKDEFSVYGNGSRAIKVRIIGGKGKDEVTHMAQGVPRRKTWIYDTKGKISLKGNNCFVKRLDKGQNRYNRKDYMFDVVTPAGNVNFISDDGLILGAGLTVKTHAFRKSPFATRQHFMASYAFSYPSVKLDYQGQFNGLFCGNDLMMEVSYNTPNFQGAYYGLGNSTNKLSQKESEYYRIRMGQFYANGMIGRRIGDKHHLSLGMFYQQSKLMATQGRFVTDTSNPDYDLDPSTDFDQRRYWGVDARYLMDTRDSRILPKRGLFWEVNYKYYSGIGESDHNFSQIRTDFRFFLSFGPPQRTVVALRVGGAHNSKGYAFFQANKLGVKSNLRGYSRNRFAGDDMVYQNTDIRFRLMQFKTYFMAGELGVLGFNDVGRVWLKGENSSTWHHGYGGGLWISPFKMVVFTANYGHSREDNILSLQFRYLF